MLHRWQIPAQVLSAWVPGLGSRLHSSQGSSDSWDVPWPATWRKSADPFHICVLPTGLEVVFTHPWLPVPCSGSLLLFISCGWSPLLILFPCCFWEVVQDRSSYSAGILANPSWKEHFGPAPLKYLRRFLSSFGITNLLLHLPGHF